MLAGTQRWTLMLIIFSFFFSLKSFSGIASAQQAVRYYTENGVTYKETRTRTQKPVVERRMETREKTVYSEKVSTTYEPYTQLIHTPITTYQWEGRWQDVFNPFRPAHMGYHLVPMTHWEIRSEQVHRPITRREMLPEKRTYQVPVTTHRYVEEEAVHRTVVGKNTGSTASVASRSAIGGIHQIKNDPPLHSSAWRGSTTH